MKQPFAIIASLLILTGCQKEPSGGPESTGMCQVAFHSGLRLEVTGSNTKASEILSENTTVSVSTFQRQGDGQPNPDPAADIWKTANTYKVQANGSFAPCRVNDDGTEDTENTDPAKGMELNNGTYDFYAYSPAFKIEADKHTLKGISHYTDFLGALVSGRAVSRSASNVELLFEHKCSKIQFRIQSAADMTTESLGVDEVTLYKMATSPAADYTIGGDLVPSVGSDETTCGLTRITPAEDGKSATVWDVLLPKDNATFGGDFQIQVNGTEYTLRARDIPAMSFEKSNHYIFTARVSQGSVSLVLNVVSWSPVSGDIGAGEGGSIGSGSWDDSDGDIEAGLGNGLVVGTWENVDWTGGLGGNSDWVDGTLVVGSWKPVQFPVMVGDGSVVSVNSWVRKTLAAQAGANNDGAVGDWGDKEGDTEMGIISTAANCYMVYPGQSVTFDARIQGNGGPDGVPMNPQSVGVLWQEGDGVRPLVSGVTFNTGMAIVTTTAGMSGNAVVAAYSGPNQTGDILWSWHIWITNYQPAPPTGILTANTAYTVPNGEVHTYGDEYKKINGNKVIMDRDLGAMGALYNLVSTNAENYPTYGLTYQWGRKDPFPKARLGQVGNGELLGSAATYNAAGQLVDYPLWAAGPVPMNTVTQNPQSFFIGDQGLYDWNSSPDDGLWGDGGVKSAYDPCPKGWRVPPAGTWSDFTDDTFKANESWTVMNVEVAGRLYSVGDGTVSAFYPASGGRGNTNRLFYFVGQNLTSWSSTPRGSDATNLFCHFTVVTPPGSNARAAGNPVRCIQE